MKKLSSIVYMWIAFGIGIIAVLMMFVPAIHVAGKTHSATAIFFNSASGVTQTGAWTGFVGYMLILLAAIGSGVFALPFIQTSARTEKIVLISTIAAFVIGSVLVFTIGVVYQNFNNTTNLTLYAGTYLGGILPLLAAGANVVALKKDW